MKYLFDNGKEGSKSDGVEDDVKRSDLLTAPELSTVGKERAATLFVKSGVWQHL